VGCKFLDKTPIFQHRQRWGLSNQSLPTVIVSQLAGVAIQKLNY
jgi:hypothetical protein